uniref:Uncharacterized protein n=1 Tax=Anopheles farauti TaxID=69004 RepID=A0A182QBJ6_9DIPT
MHPATGSTMNNVSFADPSGQHLAEKKDFCDSANSDSGFLSGHNLNSSENIDTGEIRSSHSVSSRITSSGSAAPVAAENKDIVETNSTFDSGMIPDEELGDTRGDAGVLDICERFDRLMQRDWMKHYQQDDFGETQLHLAVYEGSDDNVSKLVTNVPRQFLNIQNDAAQTALHLAALIDQPKIVRRLLIAGSNQTIRDAEGNTALHLASSRGNVDCVKALLAPLSPNEIAHGAANTKIPQDLELWNYDGKTCVHLAAEAGCIDVVRCLIDAGADINAREGKSGHSPLHISIEQGNEELANFLLDECPCLSLEAVTYAGLTAYQLALIQDKRILVSGLTKHGAETLSPAESDIESESEDEMISNFYGTSAFSATFSGLSAINVS